MAATVSLSKGVFAFKYQDDREGHHHKKKSHKHKQQSSKYWPTDDDCTSSQHQKNYDACWESLNHRLQDVQSSIHQEVFQDLVDFVSCHGSTKIPCKQSSSTSKSPSKSPKKISSSSSKSPRKEASSFSKTQNSNATKSPVKATPTSNENLPTSDISRRLSEHPVVSSIPAAILVTGVNMPDREQVLSGLDEQLREQAATQHIAHLSSRDCPNLKSCVVSVVSQLINHAKDEDDDEDEDELSEDEQSDSAETSPSKRKSCGVKKINCTMTVLEAWYKEQELEGRGGGLVVVLEDVVSFSAVALQDFILTCSHHRSLPFLLILCVTTSPAAVHSRLSQPALARLSVTAFQARPSHHFLATLVDKVLMDASVVSVRFGGKVFKLLLDLFLYHHLSVNTFIQGLKYCLLDQFLGSGGVCAVLCCPAPQRHAVAAALTPRQLDCFRRLPSFRAYVDSLPSKERPSLLLDDDKCKQCLVALVSSLDKYYARLCDLVRVLHSFSSALPGTPLGRQIWSVLSFCLNSPCVVESPEFTESWKLLHNMSREELITPLMAVITTLVTSSDRKLKDLSDTLQDAMEDLLNLDEEDSDTDEDDQHEPEMHTLQPTNRFDLKQKLVELANKKKQSKPNKFQVLRTEILDALKEVITKYVVHPSTQPLHEVVFCRNAAAVKSGLLGQHRAAITTGLANPGYYLQCSCCSDGGGDGLNDNLPDLSIVYRLHLECGRLINMYDWLQAFCAIVANKFDKDEQVVKEVKLQTLKEKKEDEEDNSEDDTSDEDEENKKPKGKEEKSEKKGKKKNLCDEDDCSQGRKNKKMKVDPSQPTSLLQARFVQAVSELQFLGFIKNSKRKTDHVARLTWGGC